MSRAKTSTITTVASAPSEPHLPKGWHWVRFGDVIRDVMLRVNPETSGLERYIAGEHLGSNDMKVRRWGTIGDGYLGPAFYRKFVRGQVLYLSRRPYLRKMGLPDFDGVCGEKTFVLEPKGQQLIPELLPYILQNEAFTEYAVSKSIGSVNPHVRFSDIANYHFWLPSHPAEQRRIADLLRAADETVESWRGAGEALAVAAESLQAEFIPGEEEPIPNHWVRLPLGQLLSACDYGLSDALSEQGKYPVLRMNNLQVGRIDMTDLKYVEMDHATASRYLLSTGDILFNRTNSFDLVGKVAMFDSYQPCLFASYLVRLRANELVLPRFLNAALNSKTIQQKILKYRTPGVSQSNINASNLRKVLIPIPPLVEQEEFLRRIEGIETEYQRVLSRQQSAKTIKQEILTHVLTKAEAS